MLHEASLLAETNFKNHVTTNIFQQDAPLVGISGAVLATSILGSTAQPQTAVMVDTITQSQHRQSSQHCKPATKVYKLNATTTGCLASTASASLYCPPAIGAVAPGCKADNQTANIIPSMVVKGLE